MSHINNWHIACISLLAASNSLFRVPVSGKLKKSVCMWVSVWMNERDYECLFVCVCEIERESEREREWVWEGVYVCGLNREWVPERRMRRWLNENYNCIRRRQRNAENKMK